MRETDYLKEGEKLLKDVRRIPALVEFSDADLKDFLKMSKIRRYAEGEIVCREGHLDNWVYILIQGRVQVEKNGKELALLEKRGEIFGEMGLVDGSPRSANVKALATTVCLATDTDLLNRLEGDTKIRFGYVLYRAFSVHLAARLKAANDLLVQVPEKFDWRRLKKRFF